MSLVICLGFSTIANIAFADNALTNKSKQNHAITETVRVYASRNLNTVKDLASSISVVNQNDLQAADIDHIAKAVNQAPATWITQGSGQEHLTAIRSPVFTGAGACGNFIVAIDNIATRASGFCNINQLFDLHYEAARQIEISRGPSGFSHGGNALFGHINLITPQQADPQLRLQFADYDFKKAHLTAKPSDHSYIAATLTDSGSFREDAGFKEQKLSLGSNNTLAAWQQKSRLHISKLNQETAGFIEGLNSYRDHDLRTQNANPEAYRDKLSLLAYSTLSKNNAEREIQFQPYVRYNDMEFLMHFLPWQPREHSQHYSLGLQSQIRWFELAGWEVLAGFDIDFTQGNLEEFQDEPSPFAQLNIPQGAHYDFELDAVQYAALFSAERQLYSALEVSLQTRIDQVNYQYDNKLSDGSACSPEASNCRFFRPSDREDSFSFFSPGIELRLPLNNTFSVYGNAKQAHRAPQVTELYRLQQGQSSANVSEETLRSFELGLRVDNDKLSAHLAAFNMHRSDGIFLDSDRQVVFGEDSRHRGLEWEFKLHVSNNINLSHSGTYAEHRYSNSPENRMISGNQIDTAPRRLNSTRILVRLSPTLDVELSYRRLGAYYLDPENSASYPGHALLNSRLNWQLNSSATFSLNISNLGNQLYAERADLAFGQERYFPGELRRISVGFKIGL